MAGPVTDNEGQFLLIVGLSSTAGGLVGLALICYLAQYLTKRYIAKRKQAQQSKVTVIESKFDVSGFHAMKERAHTGFVLSDLTGADLVAEHQVLLPAGRNGIEFDQKDQADYAVEFEEILQLMARTETSIMSFVDPHLRNELETKLLKLEDMSSDHVAILQLLSRIELNSNKNSPSTLQTPDRTKLLQKRISEGPLNENHSLMLKLICQSEFPSNKGPENQEILPDCNTVSVQDFSRRYGPAVDGDSEIKPVEEALLPDHESISNVLMLLKRCNLEPSFLSRKESRRLIEDKLINQEMPLLAEHSAVLQMLSKIEVDSDLSMDSERRRLLQKRISEGPLNSKQLSAVKSLVNFNIESLENVNLIVPESSAVCNPSSGKAERFSHGHPGNEISLGAQSHSSVSTASKATFSLDIISSLEIKSSLFSREEKAVLQLMELRAKTNRIRQSLPEWVKKGLVPPRRDALQAPVINLNSEHIAQHFDSGAQSDSGAILISCDVRADLGFITNFTTPAVTVQSAAKSQQEALEGVFLLREQNVTISEELVRPYAPVPQSGSGLLAKPSGIKEWFVWLARTLFQSLTSCLEVVLGSCFKFSWQGQVTQLELPGQGDPLDPEPG